MIFGSIYSQDLKIGVRTGLSSFKLLGPLEANETQQFSQGFVFAITGQYNLSESFGFRTELSFVQKSSKQQYNDRFLTIIKSDVFLQPSISNGQTAALFGGETFDLEKRFNSFTLPLHVVYKPFRKFEVFGGIELDFIAGVVGEGTLNFRNDDLDVPIWYTQTLSYNYSDETRNAFGVSSQIQNITIDYDLNNDGELDKVVIPSTLPAYYYYEFDNERSYKAFKAFDVALSGGASYYINSGLYLRGIVSLGLRDSTNTEFDHSLQEVNDDASFIYREDYDRKFGFQLSIGFQF